ncbi:hypothetical protein SALBM217S_05380 [Streptomyces griseoloalbus]
MDPVDLPLPVVRRPREGTDAGALERDLRSRVDGEVRFDAGTRAAYSTDGSNYRQVPIGVVVPRTVEAAREAVAVCRDHGAPLLSRGGGTSLAGECCNTAVVLDWTKYCNRLVSVDVENRRCVVEPGIVLDELNRQLAEHGLMYGPKPATHPNCTIGGMIGNNSCGSTAQAYGKVVDNLHRLEVLTYDGVRMWVGRTDDGELRRLTAADGRVGELYRGMTAVRDRYAGLVRERYPDIPRRVSGYNLDSLLPEHGFDVAGLLTGSESTLVTVLHAELELVPVPKHSALVVLGYEDICQAADHVPAILRHEPAALEGVDHQLIHFEQKKHLNPDALKELPEGRAYLLVQLNGDTREEVEEQARALIDAKPEDVGHTWYDDPQHIGELWRVRESGLGATAHVPGKPDTWEGWEDSAVPVPRLGDYLRDLKRLYEEFDYGHPSVYGHFGHGCVHTRIPFDLESEEGIARMRAFVEKAADLVVSYGGSLSGEHGDGQSRGELLVRMFGPELIEGFERLKGLFDPGNRMNPGKIVVPYRLDENLRLGADYLPWEPETVFSYPHDDGRFSRAAARCVGVGKCRSLEGGVMCPVTVPPARRSTPPGAARACCSKWSERDWDRCAAPPRGANGSRTGRFRPRVVVGALASGRRGGRSGTGWRPGCGRPGVTMPADAGVRNCRDTSRRPTTQLRRDVGPPSVLQLPTVRASGCGPAVRDGFGGQAGGPGGPGVAGRRGGRPRRTAGAPRRRRRAGTVGPRGCRSGRCRPGSRRTAGRFPVAAAPRPRCRRGAARSRPPGCGRRRSAPRAPAGDAGRARRPRCRRNTGRAPTRTGSRSHVRCRRVRAAKWWPRRPCPRGHW